MSVILRRFLVLFVLLFWQGGFLFYSAVVVLVGMAVLPPPSRQSLVTMPVTRYLNLIGGVTLLILALDVFLTPDDSARRKGWRWVCCLFMAVALAGLMWLHPWLVRLSEGAENPLLSQPEFYPLHRAYLLTSSLQWFLAMAFLVLTLQAWRVEDRRPVISGASAASNAPPGT